MDLTLITELNESAQYRSKSAFAQSTARSVCDHAFMDMIAIWILFNESEFAPVVSAYASRTVTFNRFNQYRQMGTDLYLNLHVITENRTDLVGSDADAQLLDRVQLDVNSIVRYLRGAANNSMNPSLVRQTLQRMEHALHIDNSNYRSVRRLAQSWPTLSTNQKRTVLTRMLFFYQINARRSEMFGIIKTLVKSHNLGASSATNPEISTAVKVAAGVAAAATLATNPEISTAAKVAVGVAAATAGFAIGRRLGKNLV